METQAPYYNTTRLTGDDLRRAIADAAKQNDAILAIYKSIGRGSPEQIRRVLLSHDIDWPITSIRRSINSLTKDGELLRVDDLVPGRYTGRKEHVWIIQCIAEK